MVGILNYIYLNKFSVSRLPTVFVFRLVLCTPSFRLLCFISTKIVIFVPVPASLVLFYVPLVFIIFSFYV